MAQPGAREAGYAGVQQHAVDVALVLRREAPAKASAAGPRSRSNRRLAEADW